MKWTLGMAIALLLVGNSPVSAAPQWLEDYCFRQAQLVRPALRYYEQEAYIANCIANNIGTPRAKLRKKKSGY